MKKHLVLSFLGLLGALALAGCSGGLIVYADSPTGCAVFQQTPGPYSQAFLLSNPPSNLNPGATIVYMGDGSQAVGVVEPPTPSGTTMELVVDVPASGIPTSGLQISSIQTPQGNLPIGCPPLTR